MGTDWGVYKNTGTPEGVRFAQEGSLCSDITNGKVYKKTTAFSSNTGWIELGAGTSPSQSVAFRGETTTPVNNVTGDATNYQITGYTENYDHGNNFNPTTGVFTVPSDGGYSFDGLISLINIQSNHTVGNINFNATGSVAGSHVGDAYNFANTAQSNGHIIVSSSYQFLLKANDTVALGASVSSGSKVVRFLRGYFAGFKIF